MVGGAEEVPKVDEDEVMDIHVSTDDEEDSDYVDSDIEDDDSESESGHDSESDVEDASGGFLGPINVRETGDFYDVLRKEARGLGFPYEDFLVDYYQCAYGEEEEEGKRYEEKLLASVISHLPNVQTMYIVAPEEQWDNDKRQIRVMLEKSNAGIGPGVLSKLETLYICSALRMLYFVSFPSNT